VACWSTKAAISLKRIKIDEKLLCRAYRNSPALFRTVARRPLFSRIGGSQQSQPQPKTAIAIISGTGKATECKFGRYIDGMGVCSDCPYFFNTPYYLRNGRSYELQILYPHSYTTVDGNKSPLKI